METRIAFVGSGVMAEVMIRGLLTHELTSPERIWAAGPRPERAAQLAGAYGIHGTTDSLEAVENADLVVLAVKPPTLAKVLRQIRGSLRPDHVVLSIVAGVRTAAIGGALGRPAVVRCVPNLPCRIGRGLTFWTATPEVPEAARETVRALLRTLGREVYFADEAQVERATAAYGTGPALLAQFVEVAGGRGGLHRRAARPRPRDAAGDDPRHRRNDARLRRLSWRPGRRGDLARRAHLPGASRAERGALFSGAQPCDRAAYGRTLEIGICLTSS